MGFMWIVSQLLPALAIILKLPTIPSEEVNNPLLEETLQKIPSSDTFLTVFKKQWNEIQGKKRPHHSKLTQL